MTYSFLNYSEFYIYIKFEKMIYNFIMLHCHDIFSLVGIVLF